MKSFIKALMVVCLVGESQQVRYIAQKYIDNPFRQKREAEPCREPDFCYVPEVDFNPNHPPKEVAGGEHTQAKLEEKRKKDFWYDEAKSDTPMPNDIQWE